MTGARISTETVAGGLEIEQAAASMASAIEVATFQASRSEISFGRLRPHNGLYASRPCPT